MRCAYWLCPLLVACSSSSPPAAQGEEPCGGEDTCPGGYACHDHGEGYRCYPDEDGSAPRAGDGGRVPMRDPNPGPPLGAAGTTAEPGAGPEVDASVDVPLTPAEDAATPVPGDCRAASITFVIDGSGSMCEVFGDTTRWDAVRAALLDVPNGLLRRLESRAELGIVIYDGTTDLVLALGSTGGSPGPACAATYTNQSTMTMDACPRLLEVLPASDNVAAIEAVYPVALPGGSTPTDQVMTAVVERIVRDGAGPAPSHTHAIVLLTDGVPNDICYGGMGGDGLAQRNATVAAVDRGASVAVATHVVNLSPSDVALALFADELAQHGAPSRSGAAAHVPVDASTLRDALDEIAAEVLGCPP
jgi:hypothetical protein